MSPFRLASSGWRVAAILVAAGGAATAAADGDRPDSFMLAPTAVVQAGDRPTVFLTSPQGQVEAVDGRSGRVRWRTANLAFVLLARGHRLLGLRPPGPPAQGGCAGVIADARSGRIIGPVTAEPAALPPPCPGDSINSRTVVQAAWRDGRDVILWSLRWGPTPGGAYRGPDFRYPPGAFGERLGACAVDLLHGRIATAASALAESVGRPVPALDARGVSATFTVDGRSFQVRREADGGRTARFVLRRWRDGEPAAETVLGEPPWNSAWTVVTADQRHVLAVWQSPGTRDPIRYHVEVVAAATGERVGRMEATSGPVVALVAGDVLLCYFPWRVFGLDLRTGREVWSRDVKDLAYRGPYPPAARPARPASSPGPD